MVAEPPLNDHCWLQVISYLCVRDRLRLCRVSRRLRALVPRAGSGQLLVALHYPLEAAMQRGQIQPFHQLHGQELAEVEPQEDGRRPPLMAGDYVDALDRQYTERPFAASDCLPLDWLEPGGFPTAAGWLFAGLHSLRLVSSSQPDGFRRVFLERPRLDLRLFETLHTLEVYGSEFELGNPDGVRLPRLRLLLVDAADWPDLLATCPNLQLLKCAPSHLCAALIAAARAGGHFAKHPLRQLHVLSEHTEGRLAGCAALFDRLEEFTVDGVPDCWLEFAAVRCFRFNPASCNWDGHALDEWLDRFDQFAWRKDRNLHPESSRCFHNGFRLPASDDELADLFDDLNYMLSSARALQADQFDRRQVDAARTTQLRIVLRSGPVLQEPCMSALLRFEQVESVAVPSLASQEEVNRMPSVWTGLRSLTVWPCNPRSVPPLRDLQFVLRLRCLQELSLRQTAFDSYRVLADAIRLLPYLSRVRLAAVRFEADDVPLLLARAMAEKAGRHPRRLFELMLPDQLELEEPAPANLQISFFFDSLRQYRIL